VAGGEAARDLTAELRQAGLRADRAFDGRSLKSQMKAADRSGARVALIVGPDEVAAGTVALRPLRGGDQRTVPRPAVVGAVRDAARDAARGAADGAADGAAGGAVDSATGGAGR
jgi:histidyl-tRNA synthetase